MQDLQFTSSEKLASQLASDLGSRMQRTIEKEGAVAIALSGGTTPVKFFQALALQKIDWKKVTITLVDERWVDESDSASNARLVKENLLQGDARYAWFIPLKNSADRKSTRLNSSHVRISYAVFCLK